MGERACLWCASLLQGRQAAYCSKRHRQAAYRLRQRGGVAVGAERREYFSDANADGGGA